MSTPKRIQLRRTKGWRKPEGAIVVARPSKWGNPFVVGTTAHCRSFEGDKFIAVSSAAHAVDLYRRWINRSAVYVTSRPPSFKEVRAELVGRDLACWCATGQPCHADVLIELANTEPTP